MLVLAKTDQERYETARNERLLMQAFGLSYTELQEMPMYVINCWINEARKERQKAQFEENKRKCQNRKSPPGWY